MNMKAAASLTGSLLARKGAAYPASYSAPTPSTDGVSDASGARAYNDPRVIASAPPAPVMPTALATPAPQNEQLQDGRFSPTPAVNETPTAKVPVNLSPAVETAPAVDTTPAPTPAPTPTPAHTPVARPVVARPVVDTSPVVNTRVDATDGVGLPQTMDKMGRVRLSVRLDPDRYLRVKMASARTRWSAQDIVIAALDRYLGGKSESESDDGTGGNHGNLN